MMYILIHIALFSLTLTTILLCIKKWKNITNLPTITLSTFAIYYLIPNIFNNNTEWLNGTDVKYLYTITLGTIGIISGVAVALVGSKKETKAKKSFFQTKAKKRDVNRAALFSLGLSGLILGAFSIYITLQTAGGILSLLITGNSSGYIEARTGEGAGILGVLASLIPIGVLSIVISLKSKSSIPTPIRTIISIIAIAVGISSFILLTVRYNIMILLLSLLSILERESNLKTRVTIMATTMPIIILALGMLQAVRLESTLGYDAATHELLRSLDYPNLTKKIIEDSEDNGFLYGAHIYDALVFSVPRALWKEKPSTATLNRRYFPEHAAAKSEKPAGIIGEGFSIFGQSTVIILCTAWGFFTGYVQRLLEKIKWRTTLYYLLLGSLLSYSFVSIRIGVFGKHQITIILMLLQSITYYAIAKIFIKKGNPKTPPLSFFKKTSTQYGYQQCQTK